MHFNPNQVQRPPHKAWKPEAIAPLRIVTWNLQSFGADPENRGDRIGRAAWAIAHDMDCPHILAVQEMCDDSGTRDDGTTCAEENAQKLIDAIQRAHGFEYKYIDIPPKNNNDGGARGANIRCGFFYRPDRVKLTEPHAQDVIANPGAKLCHSRGELRLRHGNPALISANSTAFIRSRKPLVAQFTDRATDEQYFIANLHLKSNGFIPQKGNKKGEWLLNEEHLATRNQQATLVADFIETLSQQFQTKHAKQHNHIIVCGDFNTANRVLRDGVDVPPADTTVLEIFEKAGLHDAAKGRLHNELSVGDGKSGMTIDYMYVSPELRARMAKIEPPLYTGNVQRLSDHNPTILEIRAPKQVKQHGDVHLTKQHPLCDTPSQQSSRR